MCSRAAFAAFPALDLYWTSKRCNYAVPSDMTSMSKAVAATKIFVTSGVPFGFQNQANAADGRVAKSQ